MLCLVYAEKLFFMLAVQELRGKFRQKRNGLYRNVPGSVIHKGHSVESANMCTSDDWIDKC